MKIFSSNDQNGTHYTGPGGYSGQLLLPEQRTVSAPVCVNRILIPEGLVSARHKHPASSEVFCFFTAALLSTSATTYRCEPGTIVVLEAGEEHEVIPIDGPAQFVAIRLPYDPADKVVVE